MKRYVKELVVGLLLLGIFYILPLFSGPTDIMGMVILIILSTLLLSFILGVISGNKVKYLFPFIIVVLFIPSVFIYYNESALIHSVWYFVISMIGIIFGTIINIISNKWLRK